MKKIKIRSTALLLAAGIALSAPVSAQAGIFDWFKTSAEKSSAETKEEKTAYTFVSKDTAIVLDTEAAPVLKALGTPKQTFEQDSCAYQGKDKVYTYDGFQLGVYPVNGVDKISFVYILDNTAATPEGIKIGDTAEQVVQVYGKEYGDDVQFGVYRYVLGNTELSIYLTNNLVDAIEYQIAQAK